jgi:hypothetical protein
MEVTHFQKPIFLKPTSKLDKKADVFEKLLNELRSRDLPNSIVESINQQVALVHASGIEEKTFAKQLSKSQSQILNQLMKELKIVTKNYYRMTFMSIGMAGIGIPMGVAFGLAIGNLAFLGIGLPIGLAIGIAIGTAKDKKAADEGKQLDVEIIY